MSPEETTATRAKESAAVAKLLGITYDAWDIPDCNVEADLATRFRKELIERYGVEKGSKIRYAEAFEVCEYGKPLTKELKKELFPF